MATDQDLRQAIGQATGDGRVACRALLDLAKETGTLPKEIGRLCNEMGLKICGCQLGCFR